MSLSLSLTLTHTHTHTLPMASHCLWIKEKPLNMISVLARSGPYLPFRWSQSLYLHPYLLYLTHSWLPVEGHHSPHPLLLYVYSLHISSLVNAQFLKGEIRLEQIFLFSVPKHNVPLIHSSFHRYSSIFICQVSWLTSGFVTRLQCNMRTGITSVSLALL